ncbi:MAG TPA: S9 family peptidase, partial [Dongiaceae bacterium]|nr:S9 family peptidase [Dongiaceae bacterium]
WQLELRAADGHLLHTLTPASLGMKSFVDVDAAGGAAWVLAGDDPTAPQLWRVSLDPAKGKPEALTREPGVHGAVFGRGHQISVRSLTVADGPPLHTVVDRTGRSIGTLRSLAETPSVTPRIEFATVGPRGFHAAILRPARFDAAARYPVILSVYGGPHVQVVTRSRNAFLLQQWFADHGFIVVSLDGRGTPGRGREWERVLKGDLSEIPLDDQVEGLRALAEKVPQMDLSRVGVYGWSFGGYFSAMATLRRPDVFRAGCVGAPVVDWHDYDTFYTERYMGLPDENPKGYEAASVLSYADRLERPLLIVHGTVDDNVYFVNSMKLTGALFRAGKPFEFLPLAGFTHMVPDPVVTERLYGRIERFFEEHVKHAGAAAPEP